MKTAKNFLMMATVVALSGWIAGGTAFAEAPLYVGTDSGGKLTATNGGAFSGQTPGPSSTSISASSNFDSTSLSAATDFSHNHAAAYSSTQPVGPTSGASVISSSYAASYWGDSITFTGGVGTFHIGMSFNLNGTMSDATDTISYLASDNANPALQVSSTGPATSGTSYVRWQDFIFNPLDINSLDFGLGLANSPTGGTDMIYPDGGNNPAGPLTSAAQALAGATSVIGIGFDWTYGVPLGLGFLLETAATDGGFSDFSNTGDLLTFIVPEGTEVLPDSGFQYNVEFTRPSEGVPEPATVTLLALGGLGLWAGMRRRSAS